MNLELEQIKLSKKRVEMGIDEMVFKTLKLKAEIKKVEEQIKISENKVKELDKQIEIIMED